MPSPGRKVGVVVPHDAYDRLAAEARVAGVSTTEWCRRIVLEWRRPEVGAPGRVADEGETLALLSRAARGGDVQAMRALLAHYAARVAVKPAEVAAPKSPADELAARRDARGA